MAARGGRILRWDCWLPDPSFKPVHAALVDLYGQAGVFAEAVDQDVQMFLSRRAAATPFQAAQSWEFIP